MMKRFLTMLLILSLCLLLAVPAFASGGELLRDEADLMTEDQEEYVLKVLERIRKEHNCDVVILTLSTLSGADIESYAERYQANFGFDDDCILLVICMDDRSWDMSAYGRLEKSFPSWVRERIADEFLGELSDGYYSNAFRIFGEECEEQLERTNSGWEEDTSNRMSPVTAVLISLGIGLLIGGGVAGGMAAQLKSVAMKGSAAGYARPGSLKLTRQQDIFLYRNVTKTAKPQSSSSSGSSSSHGSHTGGHF